MARKRITVQHEKAIFHAAIYVGVSIEEQASRGVGLEAERTLCTGREAV